MANINKNIIFSSLTQHVNNEWAEKALKKNPEYAKAISAITTADLIIGDPPTIRRGYVEGNSTAVGKSSNGDTVTTRTISISFSTDRLTAARCACAHSCITSSIPLSVIVPSVSTYFSLISNVFSSTILWSSFQGAVIKLSNFICPKPLSENLGNSYAAICVLIIFKNSGSCSAQSDT